MRIRPLALAVATLALSQGSQVLAQGYQIDELSARRLGDAFSGGAAEARDASTAYYNPAGLTRLSQAEWVGGLSVLNNRVRFSGSGLSVDPAMVSGQPAVPVSGNPQAENESRDPVPHLYYAHPLAPGRVLGLAINAPFASETEYAADSVVRYQNLSSELTGTRLTVSLAQVINDRLSLGGGVVVQQMDGEIVTAIDTTMLCSAGGGNCGVPGDGSLDGRLRLDGDDIGLGYTLGLLYQIDTKLRAGLNYRSRIQHELSGNATVTMPIALSSFFSTHTEGAHFSLTTPEAVSASLFHQCSERLSLQGDVTWTRWSRFESLDIDTDSGVTISQPQHWKNNWRVAVGGEYQLTGPLALRAGLAYDQSPTPKGQRSLGFPLDDYRAVSVGASYDVTPRLGLDLGLQRTASFRSEVHDGDLASSGGESSGSAKSSTWSWALGFNWRP